MSSLEEEEEKKKACTRALGKNFVLASRCSSYAENLFFFYSCSALGLISLSSSFQTVIEKAVKAEDVGPSSPAGRK